jgi:hypothetical protein
MAKIHLTLIILLILLLNVGADTVKAAETDQQSIAQTLAAKSEDIQKCALDSMPDQGGMQIHAEVAIDSKGQVVDVKVTVSAGNNSSAPVKVKTCVESVIRDIRFPATSAPLTFIRRSWSFAGAD